MISDGNTFTSSQDIVDAFGHLFAGVFSSSDNHICGQYCDNIRCEFCDKKCCPSLQLKSSCESSSVLHPFKINESDVVKAVKRIKSNNIAGPDRVPAFIVSDCISCFVVPLLHIFNLIIKTSVYPSSWLISRVCPVFKNGDKFDINNYRPIAILSNFAKLFESILSNVIYAHVVNLISNDQHGFIKGKSTSTNLFEFTQLVSQALDNRLQVDVIYTDLTKAFDKVHHCILLKKLQRFGFCASLVSLLKAMVMNRFQYVEYNGYKSREFSCNSGVAQGSNLGPLLFIIFFNDISEYINSKFFVYADDLKLIKFINSSSDCYDLQDSIDSFVKYCSINCLVINKSKCKIMSITRKTNLINYNYNINGNVLERCNQFRDLGVIIDTKLSFVPHIEYITNSALKLLGFIIRNSSDFRNIFSIRLLFNSLVRTKLEYCSSIWSPAQQMYVTLLENVLRKYCKFLFFKMFGQYPVLHCNQNVLLNLVNERSLVSRRNVASLAFIQKIVNGSIKSEYLLNQIKIVVPRAVSRSPLTFFYNIPNTFHHYNSPMLNSFKLWNCIQNKIDIFHDDLSKRKVKDQLLDYYMQC